MSSSPLPRWDDMTADAVRALVKRDPVAILPLAATEQHGPHLPLSTDLHIGMGLLAAAFQGLPQDLPARVLPPVTFGASLEHLRFPGTVSISSGELQATIESVGASLAAAGVRRLVLANSHGGNTAAMEAAGLRLRERRGLLVVKVSYPRFPRPTDVNFPETEWTHGLHGGAVETSMMLHLRPDLVGDPPPASPPSSLGEELGSHLTWLAPEGPASFSWLAGDLHPSGVVGRPELASPEAGRLLVEHYGRILAEVVEDAHRFPLERLHEPQGR